MHFCSSLLQMGLSFPIAVILLLELRYAIISITLICMEDDNLRNEKGINNQMLFKITKKFMNSIVHKSIGALTFRDRQNQFLAGTATLISPNIILTAAHNIYDKKYKYEYKNFKFYLGACGEVEDHYEIEGWKMMDQFKTCPDNEERIPFDFALMKLKDNPKLPAQQKQLLALESVCQRCNRQELTLSIFGYPIRHPGYDQNYRPLDPQFKMMEINQYGLTCDGRVVDLNISKSIISYFINTYMGQSGSPIICQNRIIGIHIMAGRNHQQLNIGRLMTNQAINTLQNWIRQLVGLPLNRYLHTHEKRFSRLMITIRHGQRLYPQQQYYRQRNLSVFQFLRKSIEDAQPYHCLMVQGQVLMPADNLSLIQTLVLRADMQEVTMEILEDSARFYFYTVLYNQFKDLPLSTYSSQPNFPDQNNLNQLRRYVLACFCDNQSRYGDINRYLRSEIFDKSRDNQTLQLRQHIEKLIKVCKDLPRFPQRFVFRGVRLSYKFRASEQDQCVEMRSFTSTSGRRSIAQAFMRKTQGLFFIISHFTGKLVQAYTSYPGQNEVIMMPFTKFYVESHHGDKVNLIELSGPIDYAPRILIWIEDFQTDFYKEIQSLKIKYKFQVLYVPSFFIFTKWQKQYGWLLRWKKTEVRIVLNISLITKRRSRPFYNPFKHFFQAQDIFKQLQEKGLRQDVINQETQLIFLSWFYHEKKCSNKVLVYCSNLKTYQKQAKINSIKGNFVLTDKLSSIQQYMKFE